VRVSLPSRAIARLSSHSGALIVLTVFVALSLYYNVSIPLWESDSEWAHYHYVRFILDLKSLPTVHDRLELQPPATNCGGQPYGLLSSGGQFRQPPLYYLLGAASISWVNTADNYRMAINPHVFTDPARAGINVAVHPAGETPPYQGTILSVHVLRLMSGLIGLLGLVAAYLMGMLFFQGTASGLCLQKRSVAVVVLAVNAFIPQYIFSSSVVNNDILAGALGSWCAYFCVLALLRQPKPVVLALALATAALAMASKPTSLPLVLFALVASAISLIREWRRDRQRFWGLAWRMGLLVGALGVPIIVLAVRARFSLYQFILRYITAANVQALLRSVTTLGQDTYSPLSLPRAGTFSFMTFWGLFGNDDLALPRAVIIPLVIISLLALAGLIRYITDGRKSHALREAVAFLVACVFIAWVISAVKSMGTSEPRGRYLLPVYSQISLLLVLGTYHILPERIKLPGVRVLAGGLLALAIAVPLFLIGPAYAPPALARSPELLPGEEPLHATFGGLAELVGYRIEPDRVGLFERVKVTLVWRAVGETSDNYTVSLHLLDGADRSHGTLHTFPGHGNFATSLWRTGDVFRDTYDLYLGPSARPYLPSLGRVKVTLHCYGAADDRHLQVTDAGGNLIGDAVTLGRLKLADENAASPNPVGTEAVFPAQPEFVFGEQIALRSYEVKSQPSLQGQKVSVELKLEALRQPTADYTVFAHLVNGRGETIAGYDQPLTGMYYPSSLWAPGEVVKHQHKFTLPSDLPVEEYTLFMGLYDPASGQRLPLRDASGARVPEDQFQAGKIIPASPKAYLPWIVASPP
jgi:hypothetical protein